ISTLFCHSGLYVLIVIACVSVGFVFFFFFLKKKTAYDFSACLGGWEMCKREIFSLCMWEAVVFPPQSLTFVLTV
ncbi:hypothetical protein, partial [Salmonella enterica]|uniref:hypothetical protein n=1 Tax=Salmonella enterica TaxID=28901 RepID=UPI0038B6E946